MKGKRVDMGDSRCGIARSLSVVGEWWSLLIIRDAHRGLSRFSDFQKNLGLARNILSARLKKLVAEGILRIEEDPASAASHRYVLTPKGEELGVVLVALWQWGEAHCFQPGERTLHIVARSSGKSLEKLQLRAGGQPISAADFRVAGIEDGKDVLAQANTRLAQGARPSRKGGQS